MHGNENVVFYVFSTIAQAVVALTGLVAAVALFGKSIFRTRAAEIAQDSSGLAHPPGLVIDVMQTGSKKLSGYLSWCIGVTFFTLLVCTACICGSWWLKCRPSATLSIAAFLLVANWIASARITKLLLEKLSI